MFTNLGGAFAGILALGTFLLTGAHMSNDDFTAWGWRIPWLVSTLLVAVGLYGRLQTDETPDFKAAAKSRRAGDLPPFGEAFARQWKEILRSAGSLVLPIALAYICLAFLTNYGTTALHLARPQVLGAGMLGNVFNMLAIIAGGMLTDRFAARRGLLISNIVGIPWVLVLFPLLNTGSLAIFWLAMSVTFAIAGVRFRQYFPERTDLSLHAQEGN